VKKQVDSGIDLVNDGEMSKPSYATYFKDRLTGFAGRSSTFVYQDLSAFPNLAMRGLAIPAGPPAERPPATARSGSATRPRRNAG
jgi:5-methyltetrahydropteroyltriglutamate--homocysteine methyltransferase